MDVTDPDAWDAALTDFHARAGRIDAVDNNAGLLIDGPLPDAEPEQIRRLIDVNATGLTLGARAAFPYLRATRGTLVNMSSASAIYGQPGIAAYSATKFYVAGLTEALNLEWKKDKVRVVDVWPLWAKTSLADNGAASVKRLGVRITPEDVAGVVWTAVNPPSRWARGKVHYGVSRLDKLMYLGRSLAPDRVTKTLTRLLAG